MTMIKLDTNLLNQGMSSDEIFVLLTIAAMVADGQEVTLDLLAKKTRKHRDSLNFVLNSLQFRSKCNVSFEKITITENCEIVTKSTTSTERVKRYRSKISPEMKRFSNVSETLHGSHDTCMTSTSTDIEQNQQLSKIVNEPAMVEQARGTLPEEPFARGPSFPNGSPLSFPPYNPPILLSPPLPFLPLYFSLSACEVPNVEQGGDLTLFAESAPKEAVAKQAKRAKPATIAKTPAPDYEGEVNEDLIPDRALVKITSDFDPNDDWLQSCLVQGFTKEQADIQLHKFVTYYTVGTKAGHKTTKRGWRQRWENWLSNAAKWSA